MISTKRGDIASYRKQFLGFEGISLSHCCYSSEADEKPVGVGNPLKGEGSRHGHTGEDKEQRCHHRETATRLWICVFWKFDILALKQIVFKTSFTGCRPVIPCFSAMVG